MRRFVALAGFAMALGTAPVANAVPFGFDCITGNVAGDCAIGEAQLSVDVTQSGSQVLFTFSNSGPDASSITDVYFDDGVLLSIAMITGSAGVDFSEGASPPNLPGGAPIGFSATFALDSDPPAQPNGVNPTETLAVLMNLTAGSTFADVLADLGDGTLRIGIHVQGFATGGSESFVHQSPVPGPHAAILFLAGTALAAHSIRRRR